MRRLALALVPLIGLALAVPGQAAPTKVPQIKDAAGDAVGAQAGTDVVSVLYTTTGKGSGKAYVAKQLVVTMTMAGPVVTTPGFTYEVEAITDTCGSVMFTLEPGTAYQDVTGLNGWAEWGDCTIGDGNIELLTAAVKGKTITWSFSLKAIPVKLGAVFSEFQARVDPSNPVVPLPSNTTGAELGLVDKATGAGTWKLS